MTPIEHEMDASAAAIRRSLQQWVQMQQGIGHPAGLVRAVIRAEAARIEADLQEEAGDER